VFRGGGGSNRMWGGANVVRGGVNRGVGKGYSGVVVGGPEPQGADMDDVVQERFEKWLQAAKRRQREEGREGTRQGGSIWAEWKGRSGGVTRINFWRLGNGWELVVASRKNGECWIGAKDGGGVEIVKT